MPTAVNNLVVVADLHCGCKLGLCPPEPQLLEGGGTYRPSRFQRKVWGWWETFWNEYVPAATHDEPYAVVFCGDTLEGEHHGSTTPITNNKADQARIAEKAITAVLNPNRITKVYFIRGTRAHDDEAGMALEQLAKTLSNVVPVSRTRDGFYSRWELWTRVGHSLVQCMHTIGTTSSAQHETSALNAEIARVWADCARWRREPPQLLVRAHRHRSCEVRLPTRETPRGKSRYGTACYAGCFVVAGWQGKTPYQYVTSAGRTSTPQFGGSIIRQGDQELHTRHCVWTLEPDREE